MDRIRLLAPAFLLLFLFPAPGRQDSGPIGVGFTVRDSAGIRMEAKEGGMMSSRTVLLVAALATLGCEAAAAQTWSVSKEPSLQIGARTGPTEYLFGRIAYSAGSGSRGVFRQSDGRIVVADRIDRTVRVFDRAGRFLLRFGGKGDGPGEFGTNLNSCIPNGDEIVVFESTRASFFDRNGEFLHRAQLQLPGAMGIQGVFPDRSLLVRVADPTSTRDPMAEVLVGTRAIRVLEPDGRLRDWTLVINSMTIVQFSTGGGEKGSTIQRHGPSSLILVAGNEFIYGWPASYEIGVYGRDGELKRTIRRDWQPVPLTKAHREAPRPFNYRLPEHYPAFDRGLVDRVGHLWVRRGEPPHTWDVFDLAGGWVASVALPAGVEIHDIGEDYVLGVWKDELDVEYVRMYSLDRGG